MTERLSFNLVDEPWIPVSMLDGSDAELSLRDLFARAHEARGFNEPSPLTYISVARFLLAIAHRALEGPRSARHWVEIWQGEQFDVETFDAYFDQWHHRFDLFDPDVPFAQAPRSGFEADERTKALSKLGLELASGTNATLFDHSADRNIEDVSPAFAARMILTACNFGFGEGGIYRDTTLVRFAIFLLEGSNLFDTLMLNLQPYDPNQSLSSGLDSPWWESDAPLTEVKDETPPRGLTDHLTRRGRKVLLQTQDDGAITGMYYRPGLTFDASQEGSDPFFAWQMNKEEKLTPLRLRKDRALWRDSTVLFQTSKAAEVGAARSLRPMFLDNVATLSDEIEDHPGLRSFPPLKIMAFGLVSRPGQASAQLWRTERLPLPLEVVLNSDAFETVHHAIAIAEKAGDVLRRAGNTLAVGLLTSGDRKPDKADVMNRLTLLRIGERYWPQLEPRFHAFLERLEDPDTALDKWIADVRYIARQAYKDAALVVEVGAQGMRASMRGERSLNWGLRHLLDEHQSVGTETSQHREVTAS